MQRDAHEVFGSLVDYFRDYRDCASDYSESVKSAVYDEMQELIDELHGLEVSIQYATRKVHLKVSGEQSEARPLTVQMSYLIAFERGKAPSKFAVQKNLIFHSDQNCGEHPYGMTGARLVGHALIEGKRRGVKFIVISRWLDGVGGTV